MQPAESVRLQLVIPFYQPLGTDAEALQRLWQEQYWPLIRRIDEAGARVALHWGGHLLDHVARRHEADLMHIKRMAQARRIEVLGGPFYGGAPALLAEMDVQGQLQMAAEFWESVLGWAPRGLWLAQLAWSVELPRLLADAGIEYGFVGSHQVLAADEQSMGLGVIERGEQRLAAFVLDAGLSAALPSRPVDEWIEAVLDKSHANPQGPLSVWVSAEALLAAPAEWRDAFITALAGGRPEIELVLPADSFAEARFARRLRLDERCPDELNVAAGLTWADLARRSVAVDTLHRRMLRASAKLKDAIESMQDEELEERWSDSLATAQRLIFSAQSLDPYVQPSPHLVQQHLSRLVRAEAMIDGLVQGDDDFMATEEEDADGDLCEEVFVCTHHLTAWLVPIQGACVRSLDHRLAGLSVIAPPEAIAAASAGAVGIRERLLDQRATAAELFSGTAVELLPARPRWQVAENAIDEDGDCAYHLTVCTEVALDGVSPRSLTLDKSVSVPIDAAELRLHYKLALSGAPEVVLVTEIPLAFASAVTLWRDGAAADAHEELLDVGTLRIEAADGTQAELICEPAAEVWVERRDAQTVVLAPVVRLDGAAEVRYTLRLLTAESSQRAGAHAGEGET